MPACRSPGCRSCSAPTKRNSQRRSRTSTAACAPRSGSEDNTASGSRRLAAGDSLALPPEAVAYLARLRELGIPQRAVDLERDAWILVAAQLPDQMPTLMALKSAQIETPAVTALYLELVEAADWDADDPRLPAFADRLVSLIEQSTEGWEDYENTGQFALDDGLVALLDQVFLDTVPIAPRLLQLLEERGWTGWTRLERIDRARDGRTRRG